MSHLHPSVGLDRRTFLRIAGAAGLGLPALLAACGGTAAPPSPASPASSGAASTLASGVGAASAAVRASTPASAPASAAASAGAKTIFPTHLPIPGPAPDLPASDAGLVPGYLNFPKNLFKSVPTPPGKGGPVTALTTSHKPPAAPLDQNAAWQELNKQLNAQINITRVLGNDYPAKIATMAAGNDVPDMFLWDSNQLLIDNMLQFVETAYADLTPYLSGDNIKAYPNLATFRPSSWKTCVFDDAIYGVPVTRIITNYIWFINQSRWDAIGAGQPKDADDFKRILKELTRPQANQYGMSPNPPAYGLQFTGKGDVPMLAMWGVPNNWSVDSAGKFTKDIETEAFNAALGYVRDLYSMGVFFPDQTGNSNDNLLAGRANVLATGWGSYQTFLWDPGLKLNPPVKVRTLHPFSHDGGKPTWHQYELNVGITPIKKGSPDRIRELLGILNFLAAPFGSQEDLLLEFGVQGTDFNFDGNGNPILTTKGNADLNLEPNYIAQRPQVLFDPNDAEFTKTAYADVQSLIPALVQDPSTGLYSATLLNKNGNLTKNFSDGLADIVTGRSPLTKLTQLIADWRTGGGDAIRTELEKAYAAAKNS